MGVRAWIADDGELGALRTLLKERQISYADVDEEPPCEVDLLVSNPRRALDVERSRNRLAPRMHIVMAHELTRTMRQRLQRSACDFIVDENVHPSALRLLLEYALYRGPERREGTRVPMGTEVKLKVGWRQRKGTLVQLSERGCGIMLDAEISGDDISLRLPAAWGGKRIEVPVRVVDQSEQKGVGRIVSFIFRRVGPIEGWCRVSAGSEEEGARQEQGAEQGVHCGHPPRTAGSKEACSAGSKEACSAHTRAARPPVTDEDYRCRVACRRSSPQHACPLYAPGHCNA